MTNFNDFTAHGYEVIRELGANRGAGRIAYLAWQVNAEQLVLIKQFQFDRAGSNWDGYKEIDREIEILQQLQHPNIPRYLASFETPHSFCIVQEHIYGKTLSEIISDRQLYTPEQVKEIILKLLEVLVYLQTEFTDPVLHRDIKPANILIDNSFQPFLIDFGGVKVSEGAGGSIVAVERLSFMPPEQRFGQFDRTTDLYSLGMSIVCWLSRKEPTEMRNVSIIGTNKVRVMNLKKLLSAYSLDFVDWLEKLVEPDPQNRYPDAEAALNAFKPLDAKPLPVASMSSPALEFTATTLGERITQILTVQNNISDTILEGWWEVAPHPSDPPHTPNSHAWISFGSRKFSRNDNECSIVVDTDKLMAGMVYQRQILLHSNSTVEVEKLDVIVRTAKGSTIVDMMLSYIILIFSLMYLLLLVGALIAFPLMNTDIFLVALDVLVVILFLFLIFSKELAKVLAGCILLFIYIQFRSFSNYPFFAILQLFSTIGIAGACLKSTDSIFNQISNNNLSRNILLSVLFSGIFISLVCIFLEGYHDLFPVALISASFPVISALAYLTIDRMRLVSEYRDSQESLIEP
jgi:serine/threonine protein kinase